MSNIKIMKQIRLENFRCYSDISVNFRPGINLLIGDNASGKTTILKACRYVLSSFFSGFSDDNTVWTGLGVDDFSVRIANGNILQEQPIKIHFTCDDTQYDTLQIGGVSYNPGLDNQEFVLQKNSAKNSRSLVAGISDYKNYAHSLYDSYVSEQDFNRVHALPLFACFTTEDIHASRKINPSKFKNYVQKASFGYYECLDAKGFYPYWVKRLLILQEAQRNIGEIEIVRSAIVSALGPNGCNVIQDMQVRANQGKVYYIFTDGREVESEKLSDGYMRVINIVTDIAFRCALLNGGLYGAEAAERTKGTVLIDEIDLHLHPTLQATVLKGLHNAFPQLQFIITTHAPMVMTGIESNAYNIVYKLSFSDSVYNIQEARTYGMDVSTITEVVLEQTPRDKSVDERLKELFDLIDDDGVEEARTLLEELKLQFGDNIPDLARAEAMLDFSIVD